MAALRHTKIALCIDRIVLRIKRFDALNAEVEHMLDERIVADKLRMSEDGRTARILDQSDDLFWL